MRSSQLSLNQYDSDKIANRYLEYYDPIFASLVNEKVALLELGIHKGGSLMLWKDYFPLGIVTGIDIALPRDFKPSERIHIYEGSQSDIEFLSHVANENAPQGFDIIIDDASHVGGLTKTSFWHLFDNHLKPNGLYVIEDWGTGYWDDWSDGKSFDIDMYNRKSTKLEQLWFRLTNKLRLKTPMQNHNYGMVGFIKQLVDEQGAQSATRKRFRDPSKRSSKFDSIIITPPMVFIRKANLNTT